MTLKLNNRRIKKPVINGQAARLLLLGGRQVWPCRKPVHMDRLIPIVSRMVEDSIGRWFEVGFQAEGLTGSAATGWADSRGYVALQMHHSTDLLSWSTGKFIDGPDSGANLGGGLVQYWARSTAPHRWFQVLVDLRATTTRYGKTITGLELQGIPISLPRYPYSMPSQAALLQADLLAAGYTGSTVTNTAHALSVTIYNHHPTGRKLLPVTMSGTNVTAVQDNGSTIPLPGYPYSMPSAKATLQTHLRNAGYGGAVVNLFADEWSVFIPNRSANDRNRNLNLTISPGDPYPVWDMFGNYQGDAPATGVTGYPENLRDPSGSPLLEHDRQFARLGMTRGPRTLP